MKMPVRIDVVERQPGGAKRLELGGDFHADLPAHGRIDCAADTEADAVSAIALERCWRIIQALPPQQHAVAVMRWLLGMTNSEIAARLDIADGTVAAHLSAVRGKLQAALGPYDPFGSEDGPAS